MDFDVKDPVGLRAWRDATLYRLLLRASNAEVAETIVRLQSQGYTDMSMRQASLLANLDTEGTTISSLARRASMTRQGASQQLAELEADGLVTRRADPTDSRAVLVRQTRAGRTLLHRALSVVAEIEADYADHLGEDRVTTLKGILRDLLAYVDPEGGLGQ